MKPFQTHRQQIKILRNRGLIVEGSKAMRVLEKENYYTVINGYKELFLDKDSNNPMNTEQYKKGATFDEIYKLFTFDRDLRNTLLKYLLIFENSIKAKISYRFCEKYSEPHAYLQMNNFSKDPAQLGRILKLIAALTNEISRKSTENNPVKHYLDNHEGVPLWVLSHHLTLGNMSNFYMSLDNSLKDKIAKDFSKVFKNAYKSSLQITSSSVADVLKTANLFRNVCAHEERLYSFSLNKPSKNRHNSILLNIPMGLLKDGNLFTMVAFLKLVLSKKEHNELIRSLSRLFDNYSNNFPSLQFNQILSAMGFPTNWRTYF